MRTEIPFFAKGVGDDVAYECAALSFPFFLSFFLSFFFFFFFFFNPKMSIFLKFKINIHY